MSAPVPQSPTWRLYVLFCQNKLTFIQFMWQKSRKSPYLTFICIKNNFHDESILIFLPIIQRIVVILEEHVAGNIHTFSWSILWNEVFLTCGITTLWAVKSAAVSQRGSEGTFQNFPGSLPTFPYIKHESTHSYTLLCSHRY